MNKNVTIVFGGQAGSCGKGKICGYLAINDNINISINNWSSNSGHTFVFDNNDVILSRHISSAIVNPDTCLLIGPGSSITPEVLIAEIRKYQNLINNRKIYIHPRAMIIKQKHQDYEKEVIRSGSTFKGCGAAGAEKIMRLPGVELMKDYYSNLPEDIKEQIEITDTAKIINSDKLVLIEGSQGFDLDINYGLEYPYVTSRQCNVGQLIADSGVSPFNVKEVIMVIRPYPIRINNMTELEIECYSGDYNDSKELSWEEIKKRCNAPDYIDISEYTSVTKRKRRVFEMDWDRLKYAVLVNRPTQIALNFAQYIDWKAYRCTKFNLLPKKVIDFIKRVEQETGIPVTLIGTGNRNCDIIDIRKNMR